MDVGAEVEFKVTRRQRPVGPHEEARRQRRREEVEQLAANMRLRPVLTHFATNVAPELGATFSQLRDDEDRRIADERAGRETKRFEDMSGPEILMAMSSYDEPGAYPPELEARIQRIVAEPPAKLSRPAQEELSEVLNIRQRIQAGEAELWMVDRLAVLARSRSGRVALEAANLVLEIAHPIEELKPTRQPRPKKPRRPS